MSIQSVAALQSLDGFGGTGYRPRSMTADDETLAMQLLRRIDAKVDQLIFDVCELAAGMTRCAQALDRVNDRLDGMDSRLERIDGRLANCFPGS